MTARKGLFATTGAKVLGAVGVGIVVSAGLRLLSRLPTRKAQAAGARPDHPPSALASAFMDQAGAQPGLSGLHLLADGRDAFAARVLLAREAKETLDLQYYIWHGDRTGTLMLEELHQAASRGVRVRLLVDDNGIAGLDAIFSALDRHPNIEIRLFNPFRIRFPKAIGYVFDFQRLNRRMHNKSFSVDAAATIVGGRNIGDEYFGTGDGGLFADLDVLAIGPIVEEVEQDFERYWHSASAYPAAQILPPVSDAKRDRLTRKASLVERDPSARQFVERLEALPLVRELVAGTLDMTWAKVAIISDDPAKALGKAVEASLVAEKLTDALGTPRREMNLVAGYFVPGEQGTQVFCDLAKRGIAISVLTNSFAATDVAVVHAGYAPYRRQLLEAGVRLFEMCGATRDVPSRKERRRGSRLGIGSTLRGSGTGSIAAFRSGASTLHAKTFAVDRERLFIGSFNLDPRSIELNTELGFVIESPELAGRVADAFTGTIPEVAYEVTLDDAGHMRWIEQSDTDDLVHDREPNMTVIDKAVIRVAERLPIQWLL